MNLNIREMLVGKPIKMRYVYRFQACRVNDRESIIEHTGFVGLYAMLIAAYVEETTQNLRVDYRILMQRAMLHDVEEVVTGDFPRPYKYSNEALKKALDEAAPFAFREVISGLVDKRTQGIFGKVWEDAKADDLEGHILLLADFLSALSYIVQEVQAGNKSMQSQNWTLRQALDHIEAKVGPALHPLCEQARAVMQEYIP